MHSTRNPCFINLTQKKLKVQKVSFIFWISTRHHPQAVRSSRTESHDCFFESTRHHPEAVFQIWASLFTHSFIHSFLELCTMLIRSFSDVRFPSSPDNIWRIMGGKEGVSTESRKSSSSNLFNCWGPSCSSLQTKLWAWHSRWLHKCQAFS